MPKLALHAKRWQRSRHLRSRLISAGGVAIAALLSGCTQTIDGTLAQVCGENGWQEIGVRKADKITDDTAREIVGNNEARAAWCRTTRAGS